MATRRKFVDSGAPFQQGSLKPSAVPNTAAMPPVPSFSAPPVPSFSAPPYPNGARVSGPFGFGAPGEQAEPDDDFDVAGYSVEELILTLQTVKPAFLHKEMIMLDHTLHDIVDGNGDNQQLMFELDKIIKAVNNNLNNTFGIGRDERREEERARAIAYEALIKLIHIEESPDR